MCNKKIMKEALIATTLLMIWNLVFFSDHNIFLMSTTKKLVAMVPNLFGFGFIFYLISRLKTTERSD
jgi:hypothetical protein